MESQRRDYEAVEPYPQMGCKICGIDSRGDYTMIFTKTKLEGIFVIEPEKEEDSRGFFARTFEKKQFDEMRLDINLFQNNISFNKKKGTLRGMHYQLPPYEETKIVRCTRGSIYDVIIDLRENSETYLKWFGVELNQDNHKMLYIPKGFAHGFLTLEDDTEVFYHMSDCFVSEYARGIRWDDKKIQITWPENPSIISENDRSYKNLN